MLKEKLFSNTTPEFSTITQFVWAVLEADAELTLKKRRRNFDEARWPGAWRELVRDAKKYPYSKLLEKYGYRNPQSLSYMYLRISGGKKKPIIACKKLGRPDITPGKIRRLAKKRNIAQIARKLGTSTSTVQRRASTDGIKLINGLTILKRPNLTRSKILKLRNKPRKLKFREIAERFKVSPITIFRRLWPEKYKRGKAA